MATSAVLSSGKVMPLVGLGTWKAPGKTVEVAVEAALRAGYKHLDCASAYNNEAQVGVAMKKVFDEKVLTREELFVTTKLWNSAHTNVEAACKKSLADLQLDYVDLYLIHWPVSGHKGPILEPAYADTYAQMEALVEKGLVRSIGVSNLGTTKLTKLFETAKIKPAVNQIEAHPYWRNDELIQFCTAHNIHVTAYSPLGSPDSATICSRGQEVPLILEDPVVKAVADAMGKTTGQILIRWAAQRGTSVIPKSASPARIAANLDVLTWSISDADMAKLSSLEYQHRMVPGSFWVSPEGPYTEEHMLWD
jgi:alcohol dehydrogenase (NADP+)